LSGATAQQRAAQEETPVAESGRATHARNSPRWSAALTWKGTTLMSSSWRWLRWPNC